MRPPAHMTDKIMLSLWGELETQVRPSIQSSGLEALCAQVYIVRDAQKRISEEGLVIADARGNPAPHPAIAIQKAASAEIRQWLQKYGRK